MPSFAQAKSARDRLKRIEALAKRVPDHIEGALAIARAALDAQEFAKARAALAPHLAAPTKRIAVLMAELERAERNDEGRAREWLARALHAAPDPAWTADGHVSDRWQAASPVTGRLDAFEWRVPLTGMVSAPVIEPEPSVAAPIELAHRAAARKRRAACGRGTRSISPHRPRAATEARAQSGAKAGADHPAGPRPRRSGTRYCRGKRDPGRTADRRLAQDFRLKPAAPVLPPCHWARLMHYRA